MATIRQKIMNLLAREKCDARDISQTLSIREKEVHDHLPHIIRSMSTQEKSFKIIAARCLSCGYEFKNRKRTTKPGRCPKCKKERIEPPRYTID